MHGFRFASFALPLLITVVLVAAEQESLQSQVRTLTRQLAADRLTDRDRAEQQLLDLGPAALAVLPDGDTRLSAEATRRLRRIRQQLEAQKAGLSFAGSRVSMQATAQPLSALIEQLESTSGNRIVDYRAVRRQSQTEIPVSINFKDLTFWEALDRILRKAQMQIYPYAVDSGGQPLQGVAFIARDLTRRAISGPVDYQDGFRFEATQIIAERNYRDVDANGLAIHVETLWEPRLSPIQLILLRNTVTATDENGRAFVRKGNGQSEIAVNRTAPIFVLPFQLPEQLPENNGSMIANLSGELECLLPSRRETFRFSNLSKDFTLQKEIAGATVAIQSIRRGREEWVIEIRVTIANAEKALESHRTGWMQRNAVYLQDTAGKKISPVRVEQTAEGTNAFGFAFYFKTREPIAAYQFVYSVPTAFTTRRIPFRLEGLKLP
ncbi:MAG: hypothetical protein VYA11_08155 [Planctomycetota bacterium]|nr:hypothetical protein [Planctomycetota bacterium]